MFACGPSPMVNAAWDASLAASEKFGVGFAFHHENFDVSYVFFFIVVDFVMSKICYSFERSLSILIVHIIKHFFALNSVFIVDHLLPDHHFQ